MSKPQPISPSDFRLTFASSEFVWAAERRPGLPILRWPDGTLCEPVISWFGWSAEVDRVAISSMRPEAYALREWLAFLSCHGRSWDEPDNLTLRRWRESHASAIASGDVEARQVERKLAIVFCFYQRLHEALPLNDALEPRRPLVGRRSGGGTRLASKLSVDRSGHIHESWEGAKRTGHSLVRRPTPDPSQVDRVLRWLRSSPDREPRPERDRDRLTSELRAERDWLVARCMVEGGLRAHEVARLSLTSLVTALRVDGCVAELKSLPLDAVMADPVGAGQILDALERLRTRHRRCVYVAVTGKRGRTRHAPFSIDLVRDLLAIGIAHVRRVQVAGWRARDAGYDPPPVVFLSFKTRQALNAGSIGDRMKDAFNGAKIDGSGHRLRAHYATATASLLWDECFSLNGFRFDQTVLNLVMERLAEAMGHSRVTTTIRHYVDMALLQHFGPTSRGQLDMLRSLWNRVVQHRRMLTEVKIKLLNRSIDVLLSLPEGSDFEKVLHMALNDPDLASPVSNASMPLRHPHLEVV